MAKKHPFEHKVFIYNFLKNYLVHIEKENIKTQNNQTQFVIKKSYFLILQSL